jgi:hypothetical protein
VTAISHYGNQGVASSGVSAAIGGTAVAGDILVVVANLIDGAAYLSDPRVFDNGPDPDAGWTKVADVVGQASDTPADTYHATWWTKIALGGETGVGVQPASGTATICFNGYFLNSFSTANIYPYVIDQGYEIFTLGVGNYFTTSVAPLTDGEVYIGATANGRYNLTGTTMTDATDGASELIADTLHTVILANNNVGTTTADRPVVGDNRNDIDVHCYCVVLGQSDEPVNPGVTFEGVAAPLTATGELTVAGAAAAIAGEAAPLTATGELSILAPANFHGEAAPLTATGELATSGGTTALAGAASTISARGKLSTTNPFPQPTRPIEIQLGCGIYQAFAMTRGLKEIVGMLPFTTINWGRVLDDTSTSTLTMDGIANPRAFARCCGILSELNPEELELCIIRNGWRVWSGPMTDITFPNEQCVIEASDLSWWLQQRTIHNNINSVQQDLVDVWVAYVQDAMSVENSAGLHPTVLALSGQLIDRLVQETDHQLSSDAISELQRTGLDWTTIDRVMQGGPLQPQPPPFPGATPYPTLIDANFRVQPTILISGSQGANCWYVNGPADGAGDLIFGEYGPAFPATPDHVAQDAAPDYAAIEAQYGRIEKVVTESRILDQPSIDFNAQTRYDLFKIPAAIISDGALLPSCPIPMEKLVPGSLYNVHLSNSCRPIGDVYRLQTLAVTANSDGSEDVDVTWQPQGTGQTL